MYNSETSAKIQSFAELEQGWDYSSGNKISDKVIDNALKFLDKFAEKEGFTNTNAFPSDKEILLTIELDTGIITEYYIRENDFDFCIDICDQEVLRFSGVDIQSAIHDTIA